MTVLVAAASRHGATREIAERIGLLEKLPIRMVRAHEGDWRDWNAVDEWAASIASELRHDGVSSAVQEPSLGVGGGDGDLDGVD